MGPGKLEGASLVPRTAQADHSQVVGSWLYISRTSSKQEDDSLLLMSIISETGSSAPPMRAEGRDMMTSMPRTPSRESSR